MKNEMGRVIKAHPLYLDFLFKREGMGGGKSPEDLADEKHGKRSHVSGK